MGGTFTLEEANRSLVFVAPIVKEIQEIWIEVMAFKSKIHPHQEEFAKKPILQKLDRLKFCKNELEQVGCVLRDPTQGLVDFPSFYRNQPVFICWHLGEDQADFWHKGEEGFENRLAIDEDFVEWNDKVPLAGEMVQ